MLEGKLNALRAQQYTEVKYLVRSVDQTDANIWRDMLYPPDEVWLRDGRAGFIWSLDDKYSRQYLNYYLADLAGAAATPEDVEYWRDGEFVCDHGSTFSLEDLRDGATDILGREVDEETLDLWRSGIGQWNGADVEAGADVTGCAALVDHIRRILDGGDDGITATGEGVEIMRIGIFGQSTRSNLMARLRKLGWASLIVQASDHGAREVRIPVADLEEQPSWRNSFDAPAVIRTLRRAWATISCRGDRRNRNG